MLSWLSNKMHSNSVSLWSVLVTNGLYLVLSVTERDNPVYSRVRQDVMEVMVLT